MQSLLSILNYELVSFDSQSVTLGKCVAAAVFVVIGIKISRIVSRVVAARWTRRFHIKQGEAEAYRVLLFYTLAVLCALFALRILHVPLGVFTLFGGAVAIGVGFGSQNIINNFISGLILLFERPIRVGDLITVEGREGHVRDIGPRSTKIQTFDNTEVIIPNSQLLERAVINWTLIDPRTRFSLDIGFAFGTDARRAQKHLLDALGAVQGILNDPAPRVLLQDIGNNSLVFRLQYYINLEDKRSRLEIESELRFEIERLARQHGLSIPYPQRALSTAANAPLEIKLSKS